MFSSGVSRRWFQAWTIAAAVLGCALALAQAPEPDETYHYTYGDHAEGASDPRGVVTPITVNVTLHQGTTFGVQAQYNSILAHFAEAVFEATDGQHQITGINVYLDGRTPFGGSSDIVWLERGVPSFRTAGGAGTNGGHIAMFDIFAGGAAGTDINFLATAANQRLGGAILAHLWLQYYLGLGSEYATFGGDIAVIASLLADPFEPAASQNPPGLNISVPADADGIFERLEHTGATAQHRLHGVSAWSTIARTYGQDPKPGRLIAKRPRTFYPGLAAAAPPGVSLPSLNDIGTFNGSTFGGTPFYVDNLNSPVTLVNERTAKEISEGAADAATGARAINVTTDPRVFEWPVESSLLTMQVIVNGDVGNLEITLVDPEGRVRLPQLVTGGQAIFNVAPIVVGRWRLTLVARALQAQGISFTVTALSAGATPHLELDNVAAPSNLAGPFIGYPIPAVFQANLSQALGIRSAQLEATVQLPTGRRVSIEFKDNGTSPDLVANDGTYSAVFPYTQAGAHLIEVVARNPGTAALTYAGTSRAPQRDASGNAANVPRPADQPLAEPFVRTAQLGFFISNLFDDDHGNTFLEATNTPFTNADVPGRIDTPTDTDVFAFTVPPARGVAARDVVLRVSGVSGSGIPTFRLLDIDGTTVLATAGIGPSGYLQIRRNLVVGGRYFASVSPGSSPPRTTYSFSVGGGIPSDASPLGVGLTVPPSGGGGGGGGGCFIATAAYGTPLEYEIGRLRELRDRHLLVHKLGTVFVDSYYRLSPPVADAVAQTPELRSAVRGGLAVLLLLVEYPGTTFAGLGLLGLAAVAWRRRRGLGTGLTRG